MQLVGPDERAFRYHVANARFQAGADEGFWELLDGAWPHPVISVTAAEREGAPLKLALRFTLDGYPTEAPTAAPWDVESNQPLAHDRWPTGGRVGIAFNPNWNASAIYIPCDRLAIAGHEGWRSEHSAYIWSPEKTIVDYLKVIHDLLHSSQYSGLRRSA